MGLVGKPIDFREVTAQSSKQASSFSQIYNLLIF